MESGKRYTEEEFKHILLCKDVDCFYCKNEKQRLEIKVEVTGQEVIGVTPKQQAKILDVAIQAPVKFRRFRMSKKEHKEAMAHSVEYYISQKGNVSKKACLEKFLNRRVIGTDYDPFNKLLKKCSPKKNDGHYIKNHERLKWIHTRAKQLLATYGYSYEKARIMAFDEHKKNNGISTVSTCEVAVNPPKMIPNDNMNKVLFDILKNVIANQGVMSFYNEGFALGYDNYKSWVELCRRLFTNGDKISRFFNVENKFQIRESPYRTLMYK